MLSRRDFLKVAGVGISRQLPAMRLRILSKNVKVILLCVKKDYIKMKKDFKKTEFDRF